MKKNQSEQMKEIHDSALKRFNLLYEEEKEERELAADDIVFASSSDGQWGELEKSKREGNRPTYTINRVASVLSQVSGERRQTRTEAKVIPAGGDSSNEVSKILTGLIRNIQKKSKASSVYDYAFEEMISGGFGGWRITTEFLDDSFDQDIFIKRIKGASTSLFFGDSDDYDMRSAKYAFLSFDMSKEDHKERFPDSKMIQFPTFYDGDRSYCNNWLSDSHVRVCEYWVKEPITKEIALMSDGSVIDLKEDGAALDELSSSGNNVIKTRKVKSHKVKMYLIDGGGVLEGPFDWAGKFIPLVPVFGKQAFVNSKKYTKGIVRDSKDPCRIYNYATSSAVEATSLTPKDPYFYTETNVEGYESIYSNFNVNNQAFMPYNPDPINNGLPPQRTGAPSVNPALLKQIEQAAMDIYHVTETQPPSFASNPELKSGKAIDAQERLGDRGHFVYTDNINKSIEYTAEILIDLIPRIYDSERVETILSIDGKAETVELNKSVYDEESGETIIVNDLTIGRYTVETESGPAFSTQRKESAQQIVDLISASPSFESITMDLLAKDLPILDSEELSKRARKLMISQGIIEPTDQEIQELGLDDQKPDPQQQAITENIQIQTEKLISDIENQDAETVSKQLKAQQSTIETYKQLIEAYKTKIEMGALIDADDQIAMAKQQEIIASAQDAVDDQEVSDHVDIENNQTLNQNEQLENSIAEDQETARRLTVEQPSTSVGQDIVN